MIFAESFEGLFDVDHIGHHDRSVICKIKQSKTDIKYFSLGFLTFSRSKCPGLTCGINIVKPRLALKV